MLYRSCANGLCDCGEEREVANDFSMTGCATGFSLYNHADMSQHWSKNLSGRYGSKLPWLPQVVWSHLRLPGKSKAATYIYVLTGQSSLHHWWEVNIKKKNWFHDWIFYSDIGNFLMAKPVSLNKPHTRPLVMVGNESPPNYNLHLLNTVIWPFYRPRSKSPCWSVTALFKASLAIYWSAKWVHNPHQSTKKGGSYIPCSSQEKKKWMFGVRNRPALYIWNI